MAAPSSLLGTAESYLKKVLDAEVWPADYENPKDIDSKTTELERVRLVAMNMLTLLGFCFIFIPYLNVVTGLIRAGASIYEMICKENTHIVTSYTLDDTCNEHNDKLSTDRWKNLIRGFLEIFVPQINLLMYLVLRPIYVCCLHGDKISMQNIKDYAHVNFPQVFSAETPAAQAPAAAQA